MARLTFDFFSQTLGVGVSVALIYPDAPARSIGTNALADPPSVLYLLHGLSDDHTAWSRYTSIERYARRYNLAVVMPAVARSFYRNMAFGPAYWDYVTKELPAEVARVFRIAEGRASTFVAGLSMGGYGAMRLAMTFPERFAGAATFSGAVDMMSWFGPGPDNVPEPDPNDPFVRDMFLIYGEPEPVPGGPDDVFALAKRVAERGDSFPALYVACGTEDFLFEQNEAFHAHLSSLGVKHRYVSEPGTHEWGFWDRHVNGFLGTLEEQGLLVSVSP